MPFIQMSGSELYTSKRKKTEILEGMRKCISIEIHEMRKIYEGEVTCVDVKTALHPSTLIRRFLKAFD